MESGNKITEIKNRFNELTPQEKEQLTIELLLMTLTSSSPEDDSLPVNITNYKNDTVADSKEIAFLLKRLKHQHDEYLRRII
jgi:hypothetical protein